MLPETPIAMQLETTFEPRFAHANLIQCRTYFQNVINLPLMNYNSHFKSAKCMLHGMFFWISNAILKSRSFKTCEDFEKTNNKQLILGSQAFAGMITLKECTEKDITTIETKFKHCPQNSICGAVASRLAFQSTSTCLENYVLLLLRKPKKLPQQICMTYYFKVHKLYAHCYRLIIPNRNLKCVRKDERVFFKIGRTPEAPLSVTGPKTTRNFHFEINMQRYSANRKLQT